MMIYDCELNVMIEFGMNDFRYLTLLHGGTRSLLPDLMNTYNGEIMDEYCLL